MNQYRRARRRTMAEINVVPYIDVMLVLLVIFMITAPLLTEGVKVDLPKAPAEPISEEAKQPLVLTVDLGGEYYLNEGTGTEEAVDPQTLLARVSAVLRTRPSTPVLVRGDRHVGYGTVVEAMTLLQHAGVPSVGLVTETPPPQARNRRP
jgi:biopolymer transport protein TolR